MLFWKVVMVIANLILWIVFLLMLHSGHNSVRSLVITGAGAVSISSTTVGTFIGASRSQRR